MNGSPDRAGARPASDGIAPEAVALLRTLIGIDSVNPDLVPGGAGEARIADAVTAWLAGRGFDCRRLESTAGRPSILAVAPGTGGGRSLMLNGHLDTVSLASYDGDGLTSVVRDGSLYGRGAYDMKSGLAAMMLAADRAHRRRHAGDIVLALVADEEYASDGTAEVLGAVTTDAAIVVEPTGMDLVTAHRGFVWATVTVRGRAAHGSRPDLGLDAIAKTGRLLAEIDSLAGRLAASTPHPLLATGNVHAGTIAGGVEVSSYPADCTVTLERRTIPGEDEQTFRRELEGIVADISRQDPDVAADVQITTHRAPFQADPDSAVGATLAASFSEVAGTEIVRRGEPFWTDCALLHDAGIDTVMFGVAGGGAHAAVEWVTLDSLATVTDTLERAAVRYCA